LLCNRFFPPSLIKIDSRPAPLYISQEIRMAESSPMNNYLATVLENAEGILNDGDYLILANALKEAHKKANDNKPPQTPYVYFPIPDWSITLTDCTSNFQSIHIVFTEVGANNLSSPHPTNVNIKATITTTTIEDKETNATYTETKEITDWYRTDNVFGLHRYLTFAKPKTCAIRMFGLNRCDTYDDFVKGKTRNKSLNDFHLVINSEIFDNIHQYFWNRHHKERSDGRVF